MKILFRSLFLTIFFGIVIQQAICAPQSGTCSVSGSVVDSSSGQPVRNVNVALISTARQGVFYFTFTSDTGKFRFDSLLPEKYVLAATRFGYSQQLWNQHEGFSSAIACGNGQDTLHIQFPLKRASAISGNIANDHGEPVNGALVFLYRKAIFSGNNSFQRVATALSDDMGHYRFAHLVPGTYTVGTTATPWFSDYARNASPGTQSSPELDLIYPPTFFGGVFDLNSAQKISLEIGDSQTADFTIPLQASATLRITPPRQNEMSQFSFSVLNADSEYPQIITPRENTDASGNVELTGIPPGKIILFESYIEGQPGAALGNSTSNLTRKFRLMAQGIVNVDASLPSSGSLVAGSIDFGSSPPVDFRHSFTLVNAESGESFGTTCDKSGKFSFGENLVPPGTYELKFENDPSVQLRLTRVTGARQSDNHIEITDGQHVQIQGTAIKADATITGFALKQGKPLAGVMIVLVPQAQEQKSETFHRDQSDSDGSFTLQNIFPGRYTLLAIENGWDLEWSNPSVLFHYLPNGQSVEIERGARLSMNPTVQ